MVTLQVSELIEGTVGQQHWPINSYHKDNDDKKHNNYTEHIYEVDDSEKSSRQNSGSDETTLPSYRENCSTQCSSKSDDDENYLEIIEVENEDEEEEEEEEDIVEDEENIVADASGWVAETPTDVIQHETANGQVLPSLDKTTYGEVSISNSQHVRVGNTTLYKGPVTIKQFVYTNPGQEINGAICQATADNNSNNEVNAKGNSITPIFPIYPEYNTVKAWLWTWRCAAIVCVMALVLVTTAVVLSVIMTKDPRFPSFGSAIDPDDILTENVRFVQRVEWGAQPPEGPINELAIIPAPYVIISHTASEGCNTQAECVQRVRLAQTMHIESNNWSDIGYNYLIGGDGLVYVGRGWGKEGAHSFGFNSKSIGICFVGTFNKEVPPQRQIHALKKLIELGVNNKQIATNYKLLGHRQVSETLSPGDVLYSIIKTWDHWSLKP